MSYFTVGRALGDETDLENWNGTDRHHFNAIVSDQDLVEVIVGSNV